MDRRKFLRVLGLTPLFGQWLIKELAAAEGPVVAVAEGKDYALITRKAIDALGGMKRFVKRGQVVVVKPNMGWDRSAEQGANTHPVVVRTVVEECLKAGANSATIPFPLSRSQLATAPCRTGSAGELSPLPVMTSTARWPRLYAPAMNRARLSSASSRVKP